jgi:hypothetical protein
MVIINMNFEKFAELFKWFARTVKKKAYAGVNPASQGTNSTD